MLQGYCLKVPRAKTSNTVCNPDGEFYRPRAREEENFKNCLG